MEEASAVSPGAPLATSPAEGALPHAGGDYYGVGRSLVRRFEWDAVRDAAAQALAGVLVPASEATPLRVGRLLGVPAEEVRRWAAHPEFRLRVDGYVRAASEALFEEGLALKARRVERLKHRHALLTEVVERRQEYYAEACPGDEVPAGLVGDAHGAVVVPGLGTGLLVLRTKQQGVGLNATQVVEASWDEAVLRELRRIEEHIARELGQWRPETQVSVDVKLYKGIDVDRV